MKNEVNVTITADTSQFVEACQRAELALLRLGRSLGYRGEPMTRLEWFLDWVRWRLRRPKFHAGPHWPTQYDLWLARRPLRRKPRQEMSEWFIVGYACVAVLYFTVRLLQSW